MKSNTYKRKYQVADNGKHSLWELTYSSVFARILGKGKMNMETTMAVAKFLAFFVYIFTPIYSCFSKVKMWLKVAKIKAKQESK